MIIYPLNFIVQVVLQKSVNVKNLNSIRLSSAFNYLMF